MVSRAIVYLLSLICAVFLSGCANLSIMTGGYSGVGASVNQNNEIQVQDLKSPDTVFFFKVVGGDLQRGPKPSEIANVSFSIPEDSSFRLRWPNLNWGSGGNGNSGSSSSCNFFKWLFGQCGNGYGSGGEGAGNGAVGFGANGAGHGNSGGGKGTSGQGVGSGQNLNSKIVLRKFSSGVYKEGDTFKLEYELVNGSDLALSEFTVIEHFPEMFEIADPRAFVIKPGSSLAQYRFVGNIPPSGKESFYVVCRLK